MAALSESRIRRNEIGRPATPTRKTTLQKMLDLEKQSKVSKEREDRERERECAYIKEILAHNFVRLTTF